MDNQPDRPSKNSIFRFFSRWFGKQPTSRLQDEQGDILNTNNLSVWLFQDGRIWNMNYLAAFLGALVSGYVVFSVLKSITGEIIPSFLAMATLELTKIFGNAAYRQISQARQIEIPLLVRGLFYGFRVLVIFLCILCAFAYFAFSLQSPNLKKLVETAKEEAQTEYANAQQVYATQYIADETNIRNDFKDRVERESQNNGFAGTIERTPGQKEHNQKTYTPQYAAMDKEIRRLESEIRSFEDRINNKRDERLEDLKNKYAKDLTALENAYLDKTDDSKLKDRFKNSDAAQNPTVLAVRRLFASLKVEIPIAWFSVIICLLAALLIDFCIWIPVELITLGNLQTVQKIHQYEQTQEVIRAQAKEEIASVEADTEVKKAEIQHEFAIATKPVQEFMKKLSANGN